MSALSVGVASCLGGAAVWHRTRDRKVQLPAGALSNELVQLSLPSLRGR